MSYKFSLLFIIAALITFSCSPKYTTTWLKNIDNVTSAEEAEDYERTCLEALNYAPYIKTDPKIIRVNFHIIDSPEKDANFNLKEGRDFLVNVLKYANEKLEANKKMTLPIGNDTPVLDPGFRYKLVGLEDGDDGIYYHVDSTDYYYLNKGRYRNNYNKDVIKKYALRPDSILNVFVISQPKDSVASKTYTTTSTGIALGTSVKISGLYELKEKKPWFFASLLNHEIGHVLGLAHAWNDYDGCDDTPVHPNCWDQFSPKCSDGIHSNNVMDYNRFQGAYTPCQLGRVHRNLSKQSSKIRKLIYDDWCSFDSSDTIFIDSPTDWKGDRDVTQNIIITASGRLDLHCRLSMAKGTKITIEEGGELHLHKFSKIHNACGSYWDGFEIIARKNSSSSPIIKYGTPHIIDIDEPQIVKRQQQKAKSKNPKFGGGLPVR